MPRDSALSAPQPCDAAEACDRIALRDYIRSVEIGAFATERGVAQRLRFTVLVEVASGAPQPEEVDGILSYDVLVDAVDRSLAEQRYDLLETLAERIATRVLAHAQVRRVDVGVEKLDRGPFALGVDITRLRPAVPPQPAVYRLDRPARVVVLSEHLIADPRLTDWVAQLQGAPLVLLPEPLAARPQLDAGAGQQRQIDLLSQDQAAWMLGARDPRWQVVVSRTEMDAALVAGAVAIWAPARTVSSAPPDIAGDLRGPGDQARWMGAALGQGEALALGAHYPGLRAIAATEDLAPPEPAEPAPEHSRR